MKKRIFVCVLIGTMCLFQHLIPVSVYGQEPPLAQKVFDRYKMLLLDTDIQAELLDFLIFLKEPGVQEVLSVPGAIGLLVANPELLTINPFLLEHPDDSPIGLFDMIEEDTALKAFITDTDVQALLLMPTAIDALIEVVRKAQSDDIPAENLIKRMREFTLKFSPLDFFPDPTPTIDNDPNADPSTDPLGLDPIDTPEVDWSRTLEFPGKVVRSVARTAVDSSRSYYGSGSVTEQTIQGNTVTIFGSFAGIPSDVVDNSGYPLYVKVKVTYLFQSSQADVITDGAVNIQDLVFIASHLGQASEKGSDCGPDACSPADVNWDGVVNIQDLVLVAAALGETAAAPSVHLQSLETLSASEVQKWLKQAQQLTPMDVGAQRGIAVLKQLLSALTPPKKTGLLANYPNPFNPETWIPYHLAEPADVKLSIYSAAGRLVRTLALGNQAAGIYESKSRAAYWDGRNSVGERVASGLYFYTLTAGDFAATGKMLIMK